MVKVIIYTSPICPYCQKAKSLLANKGVREIEEIDVSTNHNLRAEMIEKAGGRHTVPQIFINGTHIGGFDDLYAMDKRGDLDMLLHGKEGI